MCFAEVQSRSNWGQIVLAGIGIAETDNRMAFAQLTIAMFDNRSNDISLKKVFAKNGSLK